MSRQAASPVAIRANTRDRMAGSPSRRRASIQLEVSISFKSVLLPHRAQVRAGS
jgi:hypothetical protein